MICFSKELILFCVELYTTKIVYYARCFFYTNKVTARTQNDKRWARDHSRGSREHNTGSGTKGHTANHRRAQNSQEGGEDAALCSEIRLLSFQEAISIILVSALGYSRHIRGVFVGYSWDIHMYRVCVGYVSGMCRESVEGDGARGGTNGQ